MLGGSVMLSVGWPTNFLSGRVKIDFGGVLVLFIFGGLIGLAFRKKKRRK